MANDPFKAGCYGGAQTFHVAAEDRIRAVEYFDRRQCAAALQVPGVQKTVAAAVQRRLRYLDRVRMRLHFDDQGQDFLYWELDGKGRVIGCGPFQADVWRGLHVLRHEALRPGEVVHYVRPGESTSQNHIRYPLRRVERFKGGKT